MNRPQRSFATLSRAIPDEDTWHEWRNENVGASEVAALFDQHPYLTHQELWARKSLRVDMLPKESAIMRRGRVFEPSVAAAVEIDGEQNKRPWKLRKNNNYFSFAGMGATPDYFIDNDDRGLGVLQCKTAGAKAFDRNYSDDAPPAWIIYQTLQESMLTGAAFGIVAVLRHSEWGNADLALYDIPRDGEAEEKIAAGVVEFWRRVESGERPPAGPRDSGLLNKIFPEEVAGKQLFWDGDNLVRDLLERRANLMQGRKEFEQRIEAIDSELKDKMTDAETAYCGEWRIRWRVQHRKGYEVKPSNPRVFLVSKGERL